MTFRTAAAAGAIAAIRKAFPDMLLGAGTVLTTKQVDEAMEAGATFIVSPGLNPEVVKYCVDNKTVSYTHLDVYKRQILVNVWQYAGMTMVIYLAGLQSIPTELYEAGKMDGASGISAFRYITIPLLGPVSYTHLDVYKRQLKFFI